MMLAGAVEEAHASRTARDGLSFLLARPCALLVRGWSSCIQNCARRTRLQMLPPSSLVIYKGWGLIDLPLRATFSPAHPLARRDVPLSQARASCFLLCTITPSRPEESPDCPSLRASNEHSFIVRVLRARMIVWRLPSHPSEAARCTSTEDHQAPSPPLFREQRTDIAVSPFAALFCFPFPSTAEQYYPCAWSR
jgi:hypothetical protein